MPTTTDKKVDNETGTSAYEIAGYLLETYIGKKMTEQFRCRIAEWLVEKNENNYRFAIGSKITVPEEECDLFRIASKPWEVPDRHVGGLTSSPKGWMLTVTGRLVKGETGWLVDENGLYILKDGRRLGDEYFKTNQGEEWLKIGADDIWEGLEVILGIRKEDKSLRADIQGPDRKSDYNTLTLFNIYGDLMNDVVYQAFQINICYKKMMNNDESETPINNNSTFYSVFYSIGTDETGIPIVVTKIVGNKSPSTSRLSQLTQTNKLVIAGPHGDERNAQRLIMKAQKDFIKKGPPTNTVMYFIPCLSPTMAFADARGIPVVNKDGDKEEIGAILAKLTIPYLHDLIATKIPRTLEKDPKSKELLRTLMQSKEGQNGKAFDTLEQYNSNEVNAAYPRYGIDANRDVQALVDGKNGDVRKSLPSTQEFIKFIGPLSDSQDLKVIMVHGYYYNGGVFGPYEVNWGKKTNGEQGEIPVLVAGAQELAYALWEYLFGPDPVSFYEGTDNGPLRFAGEWSQILYKKFGILSVDIELPNSFNEGYRGEIKDRAYKPKDVGKNNLNDGVLVTRQESFYTLLSTYSNVIDEYKKNQAKKKKP